jgi:AraC-like DNA-binding protein
METQWTTASHQGAGIQRLNLKALLEEDGRWLPAPLQKALHYLKEHLTDAISFEAAVAASGVSQSWFCALCQHTFGLSFMKLVRLIQITKTKELLATTNLSIGQIWYEVGFTDRQQLNRAFRQWCGCTPSQYRQMIMDQRREGLGKQSTQTGMSDRKTGMDDRNTGTSASLDRPDVRYHTTGR